ncbi:hypothetical protein LMH87_009878 [Akanthomyces muscarius]|uniref:Pre-mRNA-splicing factor n=1 Tax=Akanthomyces muscarius TaxID=2231603 RepID=A0A9W8QEX1_AKAMU|nr:hypothetical protein LMH87_009878 [Akanthomyces muscarius]KAJ4153389.1 hypothetical protein LMH87_009878 [Akanthomyces muscarius]
MVQLSLFTITTTARTSNPRTMADDSKGGRIAIKFGASSSSKPKTPASSLGKRPRTTSSHAFGGGADSDSDDERHHRGRHEAITGFGADGAETERKKKEAEAKAAKKDYVIARQPNRDWRDEIKEQRNSRRGKNLLPAEARAAQNGTTTVDTAPADQDSGIQWGLTVKEKQSAPTDTATAEVADKDTQQQGEPAEKQPPAPQTADDEALDALLGKRPAKEDKVIVTEDDAYTRDVSAAGAASTLADYEAMPVEEFGAALLRGMGWNGEPRGGGGGVKPKAAPQRRQNRLGLGAKALNEAEDLGGWDQKGGAGMKKKRPPKLADYRREEEKKKEERRSGSGRGEDSYKKEREREREDRERHRGNDRDRRR